MANTSPIFATLLAAAALFGTAGSARGADGLTAWLEPTQQGGIVEFQGYVAAPEPMVVRYQLRIVRIGSGGRATTSQGGRVQIRQANEPTPLSRTAINVGGDDSYEAELVATGPDGEAVHVQLNNKTP